MRVAPLVQLSPAQQATLQKAARSTSGSVRFAQRAKIIVLAAAGRQDIEIAHDLGMTRQKAARWRARFVKLGIDGLRQDAFRPGRKKQISPAPNQGIGSENPGATTGQRDALEHAHDGPGHRLE